MKFNRYQRRIISILVLILLIVGIVSLIRAVSNRSSSSAENKAKRIERKKDTGKKADKVKEKKKAEKKNKNGFNLILKDKIADTSKCKAVMTDDDIYVSVDDIPQMLGGSGQWNSETEKYILNCFNSYVVIDMNKKLMENSDGEERHIKVVGSGDNRKVSFLDIMKSFGYKTTKLYDTDYYWTRPSGYELMPVEVAEKFKDEIGFELKNYKSKYARERKEFEENHPDKKRELKMREIPSEKMVYITISNGPDDYTESILSALKKSKINATFFFSGKNMMNKPKLVKRVYDAGNTIGLQGMIGRREILYSGVDKFVEEMDEENEELRSIIEVRSNIIRPIYGSYPNMTEVYRDAVIEEGYRIWDWNIDAGDMNSSPISVYETVMANVSESEPNIILFHSDSSTAEAIPYIVKDLRKKGYNFDIITEDLFPYNFWNDERTELSKE